MIIVSHIVAQRETSVPANAVINLLQVLLEKIQAEQRAANYRKEEGLPEYLLDYAGEPRVDPPVAAYRAAVLEELLMESIEGEEEPFYSELAEYDGWEDAEDEFYTELELAEYDDEYYENAW